MLRKNLFFTCSGDALSHRDGLGSYYVAGALRVADNNIHRLNRYVNDAYALLFTSYVTKGRQAKTANKKKQKAEAYPSPALLRTPAA